MEEPQPTPEETGQKHSLESERKRLIDKVDQADKKLDNRVVTRFPTAIGQDVLIFNEPVKGKDGLPDTRINFAGIHPDSGPVLITSGKLSTEIRSAMQNRNIGSGMTPTWEELIEKPSAGERAQSRVIKVQPSEQPSWVKAFEDSLESAQKEKAEEEQAEVLALSNEAVDKALGRFGIQVDEPSDLNLTHPPTNPLETPLTGTPRLTPEDDLPMAQAENTPPSTTEEDVLQPQSPLDASDTPTPIHDVNPDAQTLREAPLQAPDQPL